MNQLTLLSKEHLSNNNSTNYIRKCIILLCILIGTVELNGQTSVYWRDNNANGGDWEWGATCDNWGSDGNWYYNSWGGNRRRPDCYGYHRVYFDGNGWTSMNLNSSSNFNVNWIFFTSNATSSRTIATNAGRTLNLYANNGDPKIENNSSVNHTFSVPITLNNWAEINPVNGDLTFSGNINLNGNTLNVWGENSKLLSFSGALSGSGSKLILNQYSKILLTGNNTYTGNTEINKGEVWVGSGGDITSSTILLGNTASLSNVCKFFLSSTGGGQTFSRNININDGNTDTRFIGSLNTSGTNTFSGNILRSSNQPLSIEVPEAGGTFNISGIINGSGEVKKVGSGSLTLSGANTYSGNTVLTAGYINLAAGNTGSVGSITNSPLGTGALIFNGGALASNGTTARTLLNPITLGGNFTLGHATNNGSLTLSATGTLTGNRQITVLSPVDYAGQITGGFSLTKLGSGTLTLSNSTNNFSGGLIISEGTVTVSHANHFGSGTTTLGNGATSATLNVTGSLSRTTLNIQDLSTASLVNVASGQTFTVNALGGGSNIDTRFGKTGPGTLSLAGAGTFNGQLMISDGTLVLSNNTAAGTNQSILKRGIDLGLSVSTAPQPNNAAILVSNGVTVPQSVYIADNVSNATRTIGVSGSGSASFSNEIYLDGNLTLDAGNGNTLNITGSMVFQDGIIVTSGTTVLTGSNTYTGLTTVSGGTLQLNKSGGSTIPAGNNVLVNGGTLRISSNQTLNNLTVSSGTLQVDAGTTLTINGTYTGGGTIINNGTIVLNTASFPGSASTISSMNNLTVNRGTSSPVVLDKSIEVTGTLTLTSGTLDVSNNTLTLNTGSISRTSGDIAADMGTIIFTNSTQLTIPNQTFLNNNILNLTVNGAGVTTNQSLNITGNLNLTAGTLDIGATSLNYSGSSITRNTGDLDADAGNLEFSNTAALTLPASVIKNGIINNLTLNGSGGVTLGQAITVNTSIAMTAGLLNIGNNNLTLEGSISGTPGASSYIATTGTGSLRKKFTATGSFTYPIGDGAYTPLTLNFTGGTFSSAYASVRTDNVKHGSNISSNHYLKRHWVVNQTGISSFNCNVTCIYTDADIEGTEGNIYCGKFNGSTWSLGNQADVNNNTLTFNNTTSFSDFTGGELSTLPVHWLFNRCKPLGNKVQLTWGVSEEPATGIYTIERSSDGHIWKPLGSKTPVLPSYSVTTYHFTDASPLSHNFYRIKHAERSGAIQYSEICHTQHLQGETPIVHVNAKSDEILISFTHHQTDTDAAVTLFDATGRKLKSVQLKGKSGNISTADLPPGVYELLVESPGYRHTEKLMLTGR